MFVKSKIESSVIPRSLTEGTGARIWPRKGTLTSELLLLRSKQNEFGFTRIDE